MTKSEIKQDLINLRFYCINKSLVTNVDFIKKYENLLSLYTNVLKKCFDSKIVLFFNHYYISGQNISLVTCAYDLGICRSNVTKLNKNLVNYLFESLNNVR